VGCGLQWLRLHCTPISMYRHCSPLPSPAAAGLDVSTLHQAMALIGERQIETEASGNVTLDTVRCVGGLPWLTGF
jgi:hypothetical protein